jgi:hypothetical protein
MAGRRLLYGGRRQRYMEPIQVAIEVGGQMPLSAVAATARTSEPSGYVVGRLPVVYVPAFDLVACNDHQDRASES